MPFGAQRSESVSGIRARGSVRLTCCRHLPRQHHSGNGPQTLRADHPVPRHQHRDAPRTNSAPSPRGSSVPCTASSSAHPRPRPSPRIPRCGRRGPRSPTASRSTGPTFGGSILCRLSAWLGSALRHERTRVVRHQCCVRGVVPGVSRLLLRRSRWQGVLRVPQESTAVPDASPTVARACSTRAFVDSWLTAAKVAHR